MDEAFDPNTVDKLGDLAKRSERQRRWHYRCQPKTVDGILAQLIAKRGYASAGSNERITQAWSEVVGAALGKFTRAVALRRGVLEVLVANSTIMQEINFQRPQLLEQIKKKLPDARINSLKLRVGKIY